MRALLVAALLAALPTPAHAETDRVVVVASARFVPRDQTIDPGDRLTLVGADWGTHNVTALDEGPDELPLFKSGPVSRPGDTALVVGVELLGSGTYQFICSLHKYMIGTVTVA